MITTAVTLGQSVFATPRTDMPTINVQPRYPERQNSILTNCGAHHVKSLANKFTQLAVQDERTTRPKVSGHANGKINKTAQSSSDESVSNRFRNSKTPKDITRTDNQTNDSTVKNERSNKNIPKMPVSKVRVTITESSAQLRRVQIKENDKKERNKISVWSSSTRCTESYLGRSTNLTFANTSQTRRFSTLPLLKHQPNNSTLEKTNTKCLQKTTAKTRPALQSRDINKNRGKQGCETNDNVLNEKLSTSEKQINLLTEKYNESKTISENNANSNRLSSNLSDNDKDCGDLNRAFFNSSRANYRERINNTQLMHPDWRKVPWKQYYGWTDDHEHLVKQLEEQVRAGKLRSMYYRSAEQHAAAMAEGRCLPGPTVSTVREMLEVMERAMDNWRAARERRWRPPRSSTCYNAEYQD